tara:strand:+ start:1154 stop:4171 length:3018 start_codon:yes stop_codon:yes gene_type:complete
VKRGCQIHSWFAALLLWALPVNAAELFCPDASDMFNERGLGSEGALGGDASSSVNAQSGTVFYSQPLFRAKGANNFVLKVDLNYVGSVQHVAFNQLGETTNSVPKAFNINEPEWIISVNNVAAQVLNFEEDVFSSLNATSDTLSSGQNIARLVKGYHFTGGGQGLFDGSEHVSLLKGDGGMFGLVQRSFDQWNGANGDFESCNYGLFISSSRGEQTKAFMTRGPNPGCATEHNTCGTVCDCSNSNNDMGYNCWDHGVDYGARQLAVYPGDGSRILYEESLSNLNYQGMRPFPAMAEDHLSVRKSRLRTFYPQMISDNAGNAIHFTYEDVSGYGHKKLKQITTSWGYQINVGDCDSAGCHISDALTRYELEPFTGHSASNEVLYVETVIKRSNNDSPAYQDETTQIQYVGGPLRRLRNLPQHNYWADGNTLEDRPTEIEFPIYGISNISYPSGSVESFEYLDADASEIDLEIDYSNYSQRVEDNFSQGRHQLSYVTFHSPYYYNDGSNGYPTFMGRDLAFQKMVTLRKTDLGQSSSKRFEEYTYGICTENCDQNTYGIGAVDTSQNWDVNGWPWYAVNMSIVPTAAEMVTTTQIKTRGPSREGTIEKVQELVFRTIFYKHTANSPDHRTLKIRERIWDNDQETLLKEVQTAYDFGVLYSALGGDASWWNTYCAENTCTLKPSHIKTIADGAEYNEFIEYDAIPSGVSGYAYENYWGIPIDSSYFTTWFAMDLLRTVKTNALGHREIIHFNYDYGAHPTGLDGYYHPALPLFTLVDEGEGTSLVSLSAFSYHDGTSANGLRGQLHETRRWKSLPSGSPYARIDVLWPYQNVLPVPQDSAMIDFMLTLESAHWVETRLYEGGLLSSLIDAAGVTTRLFYDESQLSATQVYPSGEAATIAWESAEHHRQRFPVKTVYDYQGAAPQTTYMDYDVYGKQTRFVDTGGMLTELAYDDKQRVVRITRPYDFLPNSDAGYTTRYEYFDNTDGQGFRVREMQRIQNQMCLLGGGS